jgi:hypothetical protein
MAKPDGDVVLCPVQPNQRGRMVRNGSRGVWWSLSIVSALVVQLVYSTEASAQAGLYVTPSLTLSEGYDDNIQSVPQGSPDKESDFIFRTEPGIIAGYKSAPFSLLAGYRVAADVYAEHSDFDAFPSTQEATLTTDYLPTPRLSLSARGGYQQTEYGAGQLNTAAVGDQTGLAPTGIENGRSRTVLYYAGASTTYELTPLNNMGAGYSFVHSDQVGASTDDSHSADGMFTHRFSETDSGDLGYIYRHFSSSETDTSSEVPVPTPDDSTILVLPSVTDSHAVTFGWTHRFSQLTEVVLRAGPRFSNDSSLNAEANASISRTLARGSARFEYVRSQTSAVGVSSALDVQTFSGILEYNLTESLGTALNLGYYQTSSDGDISDVYGVILSGRYRLLEWLSIVLDYSFSYQDGVLSTLETTSSDTTVARSSGKIYHNIVSIGLEASSPFRVY